MKVAPIHFAFQKYSESIQHLICHTGQHYDEKMSRVFFDELNLPQPDFYLGVGSGSHAVQTAGIMIEFEKVILRENPDLVIVVGDVNSTIACSLTTSKLKIKTAHVEAGLRSFDMGMPEEINRILTDRISDYLFVTEQSGLINLKNEGVKDDKIFFVGNVMIDSLIRFLSKTNPESVLNKYNVTKNSFILVTMHRPTNVDSVNQLEKIIQMLNSLSHHIKIIFPVHPRTKLNFEKYSLLEQINENIVLSDPVGYLDFITLLQNARLVITDSGGIQEETTYLGIQCITTRQTTERPVTTELGTNQLVGPDFIAAQKTAMNVLSGKIKNGSIPELWDGKSAERIAEIIASKI